MNRMSCIVISIMAATMIHAVCMVEAEAAKPLNVSFGASSDELAGFAKTELSAYLSKMFTNRLVFVSDGANAGLIIGTPQTNPMIQKAVDEKLLLLPDGKNADQGYTIKTIGKSIYITGNTDQGVLFGIYEFLEQYGAYFQITGEIIPDKSDFKVKQLDIRKSPVFKYRGVLPWANFLCGISGYNLDDYKLLFDRLTRMKFNMVEYEFFPGMAFFTEEWDGKPVDPNMNGMPVDTFKTKGAVAEKAFKGEAVFGPAGYVNNIGKPRAQAVAMQAMLREVIDYTKHRGWKTCVGFEMMHPVYGSFTFTDKPDGAWNTINPVDPHSADLTAERFRSLVKTYPNADFYMMWQSEGHGFYARPVGREPGAAEMRAKYAGWAQASPVWGNTVLSGDIDYAYLFREIANRLTSEERSKLATAGWSIEHLFPNIDSEFPSEVIFSSMNAYNPPPALKHEIASFKVAESGRRTWMIDWWEYDGSLWFPQFRAGWQETMYNKCAEYGVEGVSLVGWKVSGIEHNIRYLEDYSWNPGLSASDFYKDYTSRLYGEKTDVLASMFKAYDKMEPSMPPATVGFAAPMHLGIGIFALKIQSVPSSIDGINDENWKKTIEIAKNMIVEQKNLYDMDGRTVETLRSLMPDITDQQKVWVRLLENRLEFRQLYVKAMIALNESLIVFDEAGRKHGIAEAGRAALKYAEQSVKLTRQAIEKYAEDVRNRGDLGVIAQLNEQHYKILERYMISLGGAKSGYVMIDDRDTRITSVIKFDLLQKPWTFRDGRVDMNSSIENNDAVLNIKLGGFGVKDNSVQVYSGTVDLNEAPYLDFMIKTKSPDAMALMFRVENDPNWYALNVLGIHNDYKYVDGLPVGSINDGEWHRVTWNLKALIEKQIPESGLKISNIILGAWDKPYQPVDVSFKNFSFGKKE